MELHAVGKSGKRPLAAAAEKDARLRGDGLVVRDRKRGGIAEKLQPFRAVRAQAAPDGGGERRHLAGRQADQAAGGQVKLMRALRCDQTADGPRGALRRAVALHADDGVADAKAGLTVFAEVDEHVGKIGGFRVFIVIFRLHCAGNDAEKVFDGVRHAHHAVRFELADVDDRVSLLQICRHRKAPGLRCFRIRDRADGKIRVKLRAERLGGTQAGHIVNALQMRRSIQPAGAVAKNDVRTARRQQLYQRADDGRMDCRGLLRLHGGDKIELQRHTHAGRDPVKPARRVDRGLQRGGNLRLFIAFAGGKRSIPVSIHTPSFRQRVGITNRYAPAL